MICVRFTLLWAGCTEYDSTLIWFYFCHTWISERESTYNIYSRILTSIKVFWRDFYRLLQFLFFVFLFEILFLFNNFSFFLDFVTLSFLWEFIFVLPCFEILHDLIFMNLFDYYGTTFIIDCSNSLVKIIRMKSNTWILIIFKSRLFFKEERIQ